MATATKTALEPAQLTHPESHTGCLLRPPAPRLHLRRNNETDGSETPAITFGSSLPPIRVLDWGPTFRFLVPLGNIDPNRFYVIAKPAGILIETRTNNTICHVQDGFIEVQDQRLIRELKFPLTLKRGSTVVKILENELEITCAEADHPDDTPWSELIRFNSRASLGCV